MVWYDCRDIVSNLDVKIVCRSFGRCRFAEQTSDADQMAVQGIRIVPLTHAENANTQKNTRPVAFKKKRNQDANPDPERALELGALCDCATLTGGAP